MTLRLASFGIRGFVGTSLTPKVVMDFASAFATFVDGGRVLLGRDTRYSSPMLHSAVMSSLLSAGCEVLDFGICPTPILQFSVGQYKAAGAISISGGHNAAGWNALTLIGSDGAVLEPIGGETVLDVFHAGVYRRADWNRIGSSKRVDDFAEPYFEALVKQLNVAAIREKHYTALIDPVGGAGCAFLEAFARHLGFTLLAVNGQPSGYLARDPEPRPRSALQMASFIRYVSGDIGFVLSSDMGRLSVVTEVGEPASEEYTLPLIANHVLAKKSGTVVTNCCTSRVVDDIAALHGAPILKTSVGQAYVVSALADEMGVIGGEGSGSVAVPQFSRAFDGFLMMGLILEAMAVSGQRVSELIHRLPKYHMVKRRVVCGSRDGYAALETLKEQSARTPDARVDLTDGLRIDWDDGWVHVRPSRTEQLVRVISEATVKEVAERRAEETVHALDQII
jgi:phosphomannomutase